MVKLVITGGAGFIGSHCVEHFLRKTTWEIIVLDKLTYASMGFERLKYSGAMYHPRVKIFTYDMAHPFSVGLMKEIGMDVDYVVHLAAETHVDDSVKDPVFTIQNNVMSTVYLLEWARTLPQLKKFFYFSTDEVYGNACHGESYKEWDRHKPTNPYSASKAASEDICLSYENTYRLPVVITNTINVFGEFQHVQKWVIKIIKYLSEDRELEIHADADCKVPGSRFYIHARNVASAILYLIDHAKIGEKYNITGEKEVNNLEMVEKIAKIMNKVPKCKMVNFHNKDRPYHDLRYCLDGSKLYEMGWKPPIDFDQSLEHVVQWTLANPQWLQEMSM